MLKILGLGLWAVGTGGGAMRMPRIFDTGVFRTSFLRSAEDAGIKPIKPKP